MSSPDDPFRKRTDDAAGGAPYSPPDGTDHPATQAYGQAPPPGYGPPAGYGPPPQYGPPQYGPPAGYAPPTGYAPPAGYGPYQGQETASKAVVVLVCAIASFFVVPFVPAVVALVLARSAGAEIEASGGRLSGLGLVKAGRILAWVNVGLCALVVLGLVVLFAFAANVGGGSSSY